jgi:hypothetical protein
MLVVRLLLYLVSLACLIVSTPARSDAQASSVSLEHIQAILIRYPQTIASMQSTSVIQTKLEGTGAQTAAETWAFKGAKAFDKLSDQSTLEHTWIYDGQASYSVNSERTRAGLATYGDK